MSALFRAARSPEYARGARIAYVFGGAATARIGYTGYAASMCRVTGTADHVEGGLLSLMPSLAVAFHARWPGLALPRRNATQRRVGIPK